MMQYLETVRPTNLPTAATKTNPFLQAANEASGGMRGRLLKFVKGDYMTSNDSVPTGTEFVAHVSEVARGWTKFVGCKLIEQKLVKVVDGSLPSRNSFGDLDESQWEIDLVNGKAKDPWVLNWYLPLSAVANGEAYVFTTGSAGGIGAIGRLCSVYGRRLGGGDPAQPVVKLAASSYKHKTFGKVVTPEFTVVGWEGAGSEGPDYTDGPIPFEGSANIEFAPADAQPFDSDIPF